MAEHKNIIDPNIHEPKGVSIAPLNTVYVSNGAGSGVWKTAPTTAPTLQRGVEFAAYSSVDQNPTTLDTPIQVEFGPAQTTADVSLDPLGNITILTPGVYNISFAGRFQRDGGAGEARVMARYLVDGAPFGTAVAFELDDQKITIPFSITLSATLPVGAVLTVEIARDSAEGGINAGGLHAHSPTLPDWDPIPSARVDITRLLVV